MTENNLSFWQELKRRDVFRAATVYLVTAWLIIEITTTTFPLMGIPDWVLTTILYSLMAGFPIAVILAWIYEISPKGMIKTSSLESKSNPLPAHKRKPLTSNVFIGFLLVILIIQSVFFTDLFKQKKQFKSVPITVIDVVNETDDLELNSISSLLISSLQNSDLLSPLTRIKLLDFAKQIGKGDVSPIDETLGIEISKHAHIPLMLQASIQKIGDVYSIVLKVWDVENKSFVFTHSEHTNDKNSIHDLIDISTFKLRQQMEDEPIEFAEQKKVAAKTTNNMKAYYHYYKGEELFNKWKLEEAEDEYKKALEIDPDFALARFRLFLKQNWYTNSRNVKLGYLKNILKVIDKLPEKEKKIVLAFRQSIEFMNTNQELKLLQQLNHDYPNDKDILFLIGDHYMHLFENDPKVEIQQSRIDSAIFYFKKTNLIDPEYARATDHLIRSYYHHKDYLKAYTLARANINKMQAEMFTIYRYLDAASRVGKQKEAREIIAKYPSYTAFLTLNDVLNAENSDVFDIDLIFKTYVEMNENQIKTVIGRALGRYNDMHQYFNRQMLSNWDKKDTLATTVFMTANAFLSFKTNKNYMQLASKFIPLMQIKKFENINSAEYYLFINDDKKLHELLSKYKTENNVNYSYYHGLHSLIRGDIAHFEMMLDKLKSENGHRYTFMIFHSARYFFQQNNFLKVKWSLARFFDLKNNDIKPLSYFFAYPYMLYYKARILESENKKQEAIKAYKKFLNLWKYADKDIPELIEAKRRYKILLSSN